VRGEAAIAFHAMAKRRSAALRWVAAQDEQRRRRVGGRRLGA